MKFFKIFLGVFLILFLSGGLFFFWQGIYLPKDIEGKEKLFKIEKGQNLFSISKNLEKEGLIKNRIFFEIYVLLKRKQKNLKAGNYLFSSSMSPEDIAKKIFKGATVEVKVTIPEGFTIKQTEERLEKIFSREFDLQKETIQKYKKDYQFLAQIPGNFNLEGFLFPDTYYFDLDATEEEIVKKMLDNFNKKIALNFKEEIDRQGKNFFDIVKMASLLEREVKKTEDKKLVSGILWKRLENDIFLQVDATITFITGKKTTKISKEETKIDSPYNTYRYKGLPIAPICNPGLESILAAIEPKESDFWYYLSLPSGETFYSKTFKEHSLLKAKYLKY